MLCWFVCVCVWCVCVCVCVCVCNSCGAVVVLGPIVVVSVVHVMSNLAVLLFTVRTCACCVSSVTFACACTDCLPFIFVTSVCNCRVSICLLTSADLVCTLKISDSPPWWFHCLVVFNHNITEMNSTWLCRVVVVLCGCSELESSSLSLVWVVRFLSMSVSSAVNLLALVAIAVVIIIVFTCQQLVFVENRNKCWFP